MLLGSLTHCRTKEQPVAVDAGDHTPASVVSASPSSSSVVPRTPRDAGIDPKRYQSSLDAGRAATVAKAYPKAIAAFDDALVAKPDDARALAERGYAELLAKQLVPAKRDLNRATIVADPKNRALVGQIYFNLGLVAEAQADEGEAFYAFQTSNQLHPTDAAKKKVAEGKGKETSLCGVDADQRSAPLHAETEWTSPGACVERCGTNAFRWAQPNDEMPKPPPGTTCKASCRADGQPYLSYADTTDGTLALFVPDGKGGWLWDKVTEITDSRCGTGTLIGTLTTDGDFIHVRLVHKLAMPTPMCTGGKGKPANEIRPCGDTEGEEAAGSACGVADDVNEVFDTFVRKSTMQHAAAISSNNETNAPTIQATGAGLVFKGPTCDRTLPWPAK